MNSRKIAFSALIAALYFGLTMLLRPISFGPIQFRIAEVFTIMPVFGLEGVIGVTIGCLLSNIFSSYGIYDIIFGTSATLIAAILTRLLRKRITISFFMPVIINALILPLIWFFLGTDQLYIINALSIFVSEAVIIYGLGIPLYIALLKTPYFNNDKNIRIKSYKMKKDLRNNVMIDTKVYFKDNEIIDKTNDVQNNPKINSNNKDNLD
jgi:uncharacterized membrane protein